jgi:hypothetical protein
MSSATQTSKPSTASKAPKEIIPGETFNPDKDIKYSKPKVNSSGGKSVGILNCTTNGATYVSTPLMMTWGVSAFEDKKTGDKSYNMSLQFPGQEYNTPAISKFRANIEKFEQKIKADALANQKEWFIPQRVIWSIPLILLKMFLTIMKTISFGVLPISVGLQDIPISYTVHY